LQRCLLPFLAELPESLDFWRNMPALADSMVVWVAHGNLLALGWGQPVPFSLSSEMEEILLEFAGPEMHASLVARSCFQFMAHLGSLESAIGSLAGS